MSAAWARYGDLDQAGPVEARRISEEVRAPWTRGGPAMAAVKEQQVPVANGVVRIRCYDPGSARPTPALIYLHGGGWTLFSLDTHDRLMREYASRAGMMVIGVDYALSPEAKYPVALDQIVSLVRFVATGDVEFVDAGRIAIGGDSAGANLAVAAALRLRDGGDGDLLRAMVLNYGVFSRSSSAEARQRFGGPGNMLTAGEMEGFWVNYLRHPGDADDPLVCPVRAELQGLPPSFLVVPECDLLAEQSVMMAERFQKAGVPVEMKVYRGATHSFLEAVSISSLANRAFDETAAWLRNTLSIE